MLCGFVTGWDNTLNNVKIRIKYTLMRLQRILYPDVYCIPFWLGSKCDFLPNGARITPNKYDFIFSELNGSVEQLQYLFNLVEAYRERVVVLPGPPEVFLSNANNTGRSLAKRILRGAGHVWAYSDYVASFANSLAVGEVAKVIPWPFDYEATRRLCQKRKIKSRAHLNVMIGAPLRFGGIADNEPHFLEKCLVDALAQISGTDRKRFKFHGFVYTGEDKDTWHKTQFGKSIGAVLEPRMSYKNFLRFVGNCDAVIQLSRFGILGRITYISAALGTPGIFTDNVELNHRLYSNSLVRTPSDEKLRCLVRDLLFGLLGFQSLDRFLPNSDAAREVGNFTKNALKVRNYLFRSE